MDKWEDNTWQKPVVTREWHTKEWARYIQWRWSDKGKATVAGLLRKQHYKCFYCENPLQGNGTPGAPYELDHIKAIWKAGFNTGKNFAVACKPCNRRKGANLVDKEFVASKRRKPKQRVLTTSMKRSLAYKIARRLPKDFV